MISTPGFPSLGLTDIWLLLLLLSFVCVCVVNRSVLLDSLWLYGPPGSSVCGILQARILEWVAISYSKGSSQPRDRTCISCIARGFFTATSEVSLTLKHNLSIIISLNVITPQIYSDKFIDQVYLIHLFVKILNILVTIFWLLIPICFGFHHKY